jgi:ribose 1,5-bisphosphokinase
LPESTEEPDAGANASSSPELRKVGTLILVAGPSGAGKDTLIDAARQHFRGDSRVQFPLRVITRGGQAGERHIALSEQDFQASEKQGCFCLSWRVHGLSYGIPVETLDALAAGGSIVINVSREKVNEARAMWPQTRVIHVVASAEALWTRLLARGRESACEAVERLCRSDRLPPMLPDADWVDVIDNSEALAAAVEQFTALIARCAAPPHS